MNLKESIKNWYKNIPDKKIYIEFVTATLSIPVLITVILINMNNLNTKKENVSAGNDGVKKEEPNITIQYLQDKNNITPVPTNEKIATSSTQQCKKEVGPVEIVSPEENQVIEDDPLCIDILYKQEDYCSVVWSYRINGGSWSDYTDKSVCLYNLSNGIKDIDLRVKSIISSDEKLLKRSFIYKNQTISPTPTIIDKIKESTFSASVN